MAPKDPPKDQADKDRLSTEKRILRLEDMRAELAEYLTVLERNTTAVENWLATQHENIILSLHQLKRAVTFHKDEDQALDLLEKIDRGVAGFVLDLANFETLANDSFGKDSRFVKKITQISRGIPADILEPLPVLSQEDIEEVLNAPQAMHLPKPPEKKGGLAEFFKGDRQKAAERFERETEELLQKFKSQRDEIIDLHSDKHYYVDSHMDWIGELLAPQDPETDPSPVQQTYKSPAYVVARAEADFSETIGRKAEYVREQARNYADLAGLIDRGDVGAFAEKISVLFPKTDTPESVRLRRLLLNDFQVPDFSELAITKLRDQKDRFELYRAALAHEDKTKLSGPEYLMRILGEVLYRQNPMNPEALALALQKLRHDVGDRLGIITQSGALAKIAHYHGDDIDSMRATLHGLFAMPDTTGYHRTIKHACDLLAACRDKNANAALETIESIQKDNIGEMVNALHRLLYPQAPSLLEKMTVLAGDDSGIHADLTVNALKAKLVDDLKIDKTGNGESAFKNFITKHVLPHIPDFPATSLRYILASSLAEGGIETYRAKIEETWLHDVIRRDLPDPKKQEYIAALLEPLSSDLQRANTLYAAAQNARKSGDVNSAQKLEKMDMAFYSNAVLLEKDIALVNIQKIANIWYDAQSKSLLYTVNGDPLSFGKDLDLDEAQEILSLIRRRHGLVAENGGAFNPYLADRIEISGEKSVLCWHNKKIEVRPSAGAQDTLKSLNGFIHVVEGKNHTSYNVSEVALLQQLGDGRHLLIDKHGGAFFLPPNIIMPTHEKFLRFGNSLINPENISLLSINEKDQKVSLRIESPDFEDFLESIGGDDHYYDLKAGSMTDIENLRGHLDQKTGLHPAGGTLAHVYFNMEMLKYLMAGTEKDNTGLYCHRIASPKQGFFELESKAAQSLVDHLAQNGQGLVRAKDTILAASTIDNAYFSSEHDLLYVISGRDTLRIRCEKKAAFDFLQALSKKAGMKTVASVTDAINGKSTSVPIDIINLARATALEATPRDQKILITSDSKPYFINATADEKKKYISDLISAEHATRRAIAETEPLARNLPDIVRAQTKITPPAISRLDKIDAMLLIHSAASDKKETYQTALLGLIFDHASQQNDKTLKSETKKNVAKVPQPKR